MASKVKEDEKNERIIRSLLKQTENRRCINCNSLGPQYVCTNFWTFVCTTCSGIHREFTHRVKSVSMAKFSSQEVSSLQEGGNQRAKEIYFKEWDLQRNSFPDSSNIERLRDFIKHVYVDRRFSGGRSYDKPPRGKMGDKEDVYENRRTDGYQGGSRSPPYEDTYERRYSDRSSPGGTSDDRNSRYGYDERQSPARPEIVNDWRREDRFGNGKKFEDSGIVDGDPKLEGRSPERAKDLESSSPPVVRPIREILGESVIPLRISDPPKADSRRTIDGPPAQRTTSSSSLGSTSGKPAEVKVEMTGSLIDFDADPGPPVVSAVPQTQQTTVTQSTVQPTSSTNDNNWATFDFASQTNVSQTPPSVNTLESVLSQLSAPASVPGHLSGASSGVGGQVAAPVGNVNVAPLVGNSNVPFTGQIQGSPFGAIAPASSGYQDGVHNAGQWSNMRQQQTSFFSAAGGQSTMQQFMPQGGGATANQQWNFAASQHMQGPLSAPVAQTPQVVSQAPPPPAETKASGRQELPMDLFTATYPSYRAAAPGWQTGPPRGMGFTMQYNTAVPMTAFPQSSRSANPFDLGGEATPLQNQSFPSMASFQGALPMVPPPSMVPTSSLGHPSSAWMPPQSLPYGSGMPPQSLPYGSGMPPQSLPYGSGMLLQSLPNASTVPQRPQYLGAQQLPSNLPPSSHQIGGPGGEASFGFVNTNQQAAGRFSAAGTPQPFSSVGGNPFG